MTRPEIKKWLRSYVTMKKERDGIIKLIKELDDDRAASQLRSPQLTGMPRSGKISNPTAESAERFEAVLADYDEKANALLQRMNEIENAISGLDEQQRDMLRAHYLRGLGWEHVAREKGYSVSRCWQIAGDAITILAESL